MPEPAKKRKETPPPSELLENPALAEDFEESVERPRPRAVPGSLHVEARVVYLGGHPKRTVYYPGTVDMVDDGEGNQVWHPSDEGATSYDFPRVDSRGRIIREKLTKDGKPYSLCRHITHLVRFLEEVDGDGMPQFEVRALPEVRLKIERYAAWLRKVEDMDQDRGRPLLAAMGLE